MGLASRLGFRGRLIAAMISLVALVSLVIVALAIRPNGLFGSKTLVKV